MIRQLLNGLVIFCAVTSTGAHAETIGLRFIVDHLLGQSEVQQQSVKARLSGNVAELNSYFENSKVNLRAEIAHIEFVHIENSDATVILSDMAQERLGFEQLFSRADEFGADYTFAIHGKLLLRGRRSCGKAFAVNKTIAEIATTRRAFAIIDFACGAHTLAHELGHLMGLNHGSKVNSCEPGRGHATALTPYANGYAEGECDGMSGADKFGTIMVGGWMKSINGDGHSNLRIFSNPRIRDLRCGTRQVCGDDLVGDSARTLNEHLAYYANHEEPDVHVLPYASSALSRCISSKYRWLEVNEMTELDCVDAEIDNLAGLEKLTSLKRIKLKCNPSADFLSLGKLPDSVETLDLSENVDAPCPVFALLKRKYGHRLIEPSHCFSPTSNMQAPNL